MASSIPPLSSFMSSSPPPQYQDSVGTGGAKHHVVADVVLRVMLFVTALVAILVVATSNETKTLPLNAGGLREPVAAKFNDSPSFIYYVAALSVACFYSIITFMLSVVALLTKTKGSSTEKVLLFVVLDGLMLGIMASATGAAGAISYQGFIGDSKIQSNICKTYSSFCRYIAGSVFMSLLPSIALLLLIWLSLFVLSKKMARP